jgi:hypothetical protein
MSEKIKKKRGGARPGAGRKMTEERKAIIAAADEARRAALEDMSGETPLQYMLRVMRDTTADYRRRDTMAIAAAAYMHPKLSATEHSGNDAKPMTYRVISGVAREIHEYEYLDEPSESRTDH